MFASYDWITELRVVDTVLSTIGKKFSILQFLIIILHPKKTGKQSEPLIFMRSVQRVLKSSDEIWILSICNELSSTREKVPCKRGDVMRLKCIERILKFIGDWWCIPRKIGWLE